jgi:DNA-binding PadR family transcriptional regulator
LDQLILAIIGRSPSTSSDIIISIFREHGVIFSSAVLHPLLDFLELEGLVEVRKMEKRKVYFLTAKGKEEIKNFLTHQIITPVK